MKFRLSRKRNLRTAFRNLLVAEVIYYLIFMLLAMAAYWAKIYRTNFPFLAKYVRFEVMEFVGLGLIQLALIVFFLVRVSRQENDLGEMLKRGEYEQLEFKSSLRWDELRRQINKDLEKNIMKTVAAFLNSEGGTLVIGVSDHSQVLGLENDFNSLPKHNSDGFENHFNNLFNQMIGPEFRRLVKLNFNIWNGQTVCLAKVKPSLRPVYFKNGLSEDFYIRTGNATTALKMSEVTAYLSSWKK